jgi:hypothetical protein
LLCREAFGGRRFKRCDFEETEDTIVEFEQVGVGCVGRVDPRGSVALLTSDWNLALGN